MSWTALLLAAALLVGADPARVRTRAAPLPVARGALQRVRVDDPLAAASTFDLFAACLAAGMAVSTAAAAATASAPPSLAPLLRCAAELLALGADPSRAWAAGNEAVPQDRNAEALLRLARRSAASGSALADGVAELAAQARHEAATSADAVAERASVLVAGPLGLCYLPAFLCLGVIPVVAGLAGDVLGSGLL
ncbi:MULTISPECIES: type II secretion system F family protein [unclassified Mycolicibacterium]|uniref:type II secretion system F family protein n=1 Tax=unclassified Mycolicibacterium TaxID=2636767 RepID=UPI0012DBEBA6|nr:MULTISPECIES: type II secretion system F family protein [unclassified Mycolicibacterium]MUL84168.1 type II secretion system F family protein [Mycolicibacterium sp. CBMA 329]MUL89766.1 type II secretion system F family protein [Mycolicibacterium sp. CBMA 331]MUL99941.1 type II secretion system F family protein [Mycolicibacterium sp. CBMA 334]MUM27093.1 type II secretion system F family protein [Mycolicibacterium sp. CBMA 295]MUM39281.1 type II secretion system F family protein [Mycolicibacte